MDLLPSEIWLIIIHKLDIIDMYHLRFICKSLNSINIDYEEYFLNKVNPNLRINYKNIKITEKFIFLYGPKFLDIMDHTIIDSWVHLYPQIKIIYQRVTPMIKSNEKNGWKYPVIRFHDHYDYSYFSMSILSKNNIRTIFNVINYERLFDNLIDIILKYRIHQIQLLFIKDKYNKQDKHHPNTETIIYDTYNIN